MKEILGGRPDKYLAFIFSDAHRMYAARPHNVGSTLLCPGSDEHFGMLGERSAPTSSNQCKKRGRYMDDIEALTRQIERVDLHAETMYDLNRTHDNLQNIGKYRPMSQQYSTQRFLTTQVWNPTTIAS